MELNDAVGLINKPVRDLAAYHLVPETVPIKINQNENPYDWPADVKEEIAQFVRERPWNRYPPFIPEELRTALCEYMGVAPGSVIAGNGSNEVMLVLLMALVDRSAPVLLCQPTFTVYELLIRGLGATACNVMARPDLTVNTDAIIDASIKNPRSLLILCSPNNPTGVSLSQEEIRRILAVHSGFFILDQAYVEFGGYNAVPLLREYPNLIITRTFSKAFSGAGLRLGYMAGHPDVIAHVNKVKLPYNLSFFTEYVARVLLRRIDLSRRLIAELITSRGELLAFFRTFPFDAVFDSDANYFLIRCATKETLFAHLKKCGILVRDVSSYPMLQNCLRISIGSLVENKALRESVTSYFAATKQ